MVKNGDKRWQKNWGVQIPQHPKHGAVVSRFYPKLKTIHKHESGKILTKNKWAAERTHVIRHAEIDNFSHTYDTWKVKLDLFQHSS